MSIMLFLIFLGIVQLVLSGVDYSCLHANAWIENDDNHYNSYFSAKTDVLYSSFNSAGTWTAYFNAIPNYDRVFTSSDVSWLNSRPKASSDFTSSSATTAVAGSTYAWGANIGYKTSGCSLGYWPPGPSCPSAQKMVFTAKLNPAPETVSGGCTTGLGATGYLVNGVAIYNYGDGTSYNSAGVWYNSAVDFEKYDLDMCLGHASPNGLYHHHNFSPCLKAQLGDSGTGHSPVYGFALDSYPVYGPYQAANTLAVSCWQKRNYAASSPTGCSDGKRSCLLKDQYDYTKGTTTASSAGPSLTGSVTSQSGNTIYTVSGVYSEDYFYNSTCAAQGGKYLDLHNGHDHDGLGFHYHITIDSVGTPLYPYQIGPKYYGCLPTGVTCGTKLSTCGTSAASSTYSCKTTFGTPGPTKAPSTGPSGGGPPGCGPPPGGGPPPPGGPPPGCPPPPGGGGSSSMSPTKAPTRSPTRAPTRSPTFAPTEGDLEIESKITLSQVTTASLSDTCKQAISKAAADAMKVDKKYVSVTDVVEVTVQSMDTRDVSRRFLTGVTVVVTVTTVLPMPDFPSYNSISLYDATFSSLSTAVETGTFQTSLRSYSVASGATETTSAGVVSLTSLNSPTQAPTSSPKKKAELSTTNIIIIVVVGGGGLLILIAVFLFFKNGFSRASVQPNRPAVQAKVEIQEYPVAHTAIVVVADPIV